MYTKNNQVTSGIFHGIPLESIAKLVCNFSKSRSLDSYILFDGFTYNARGYFASCVVFGARKNTSNEENVRSYYM